MRAYVCTRVCVCVGACACGCMRACVPPSSAPAPGGCVIGGASNLGSYTAHGIVSGGVGNANGTASWAVSKANGTSRQAAVHNQARCAPSNTARSKRPDQRPGTSMPACEARIGGALVRPPAWHLAGLARRLPVQLPAPGLRCVEMRKPGRTVCMPGEVTPAGVPMEQHMARPTADRKAAACCNGTSSRVPARVRYLGLLIPRSTSDQQVR